MADSTNLSLGPNATLKLDRTVFDDEHHYREVAVRMASGAFRFVTGHSDKAAYKITTPLATHRRARHHARYPVASAAGPSSTCRTARPRSARSTLNASSCTRPGDTAIITVGRQWPDRGSRRPAIRPGPSPQPAAPQRGFAARRNTLMRPPSLSMTAAIPPACCAGADHGKFHPQRPVVRSALLSRRSLTPSSAAWAQSPIAVAVADTAE